MSTASSETVSPARKLGILAWRLALGLAVGFLVHYLLYRWFLPVQPFIYVAF